MKDKSLQDHIIRPPVSSVEGRGIIACNYADSVGSSYYCDHEEYLGLLSLSPRRKSLGTGTRASALPRPYNGKIRGSSLCPMFKPLLFLPINDVRFNICALNFKSEAYKELILSVVYSRNNIGRRTHPCGTPAETDRRLEMVGPSDTAKHLRYVMPDVSREKSNDNYSVASDCSPDLVRGSPSPWSKKQGRVGPVNNDGIRPYPGYGSDWKLPNLPSFYQLKTCGY
ncbi:hypothetical protein J6590_025133 [Homalodisca vitripennis]|nr:hypothetical protein J6590_025133 [Homalodisca vitripennis]